MATLQANDAVLSLGGTDVSGDMTSVEITRSASEVEVTAGYGTTNKSFGAGLLEGSVSMTIRYDVTNFATNIPLITAGATVAMIWQPEGNTAGKPEHAQSIYIQSTKQTALTVQKEAVMLEVSAILTGTPTTDMFAGGTV